MTKKERKRLKDIKRVIKLAYRKGYINPTTSNTIWEEDIYDGKIKFFKIKMDERFVAYTYILEELLIDMIEDKECYFCGKYDTFVCNERPSTIRQLIKYLSKQPTVNNRSYINEILKIVL